MKVNFPFAAVCAAAVLAASTGHAQLSKATQILLNRGIELQAMVQFNDEFNLVTYSNANYTSVNWFDPGWQAYLGPAPGFPWGRWVSGPSDMPPVDANNQFGFNAETPCLSQLIDLELGDELNLDDGATLTNEINWFNSCESNFPNTILYINNYAGQASDASLSAMITQGHVDMICFDEYPFTSQYNTNYTNDIGPAYSWPYTSWFSELWRYRQTGINYKIPFATYMQTFHSVQDYDMTVYRNPSASEMRFNTFASLAFNAKMLIGFVYNSGAATLFNILPNGYSGDTYTNAFCQEQVDINHRAAILGRSLACLQPVYDLHNPNDSNPPPGPASAYTSFPDGTTTSIMILKGNPTTSSNTPEPIGFTDSVAAPKSYSWWEFQKNDPYLNGWAVTNPGTNNGGIPGQVIIAWFKLLDENLDGPNYNNEIYMMVVNALTSTNGPASSCLQTIKLNFETGTGPVTAVNMLDLESDLVTTNSMPVISGSGSTAKRQLVLNLNGGDAAFFKFADGAPFVGHVPPAPAQLSGSWQGNYPAVTVQGTPMARYVLQSAPTPTGPNWAAVGYRVLTNSSALFIDSTAASTNAIFYRAVGIP
ncbi:MAG TPA: hypothetical protein VFC44_03420 [Candidatus Saccharimonadales bacterium]|nr:hypothetical protein [Candidatus Saccharimonadales bacterium]